MAVDLPERSPTRRRPPRKRECSNRLAGIVNQFGVVAGAVVCYFAVRGITEGDPALAARNAQRLLRVEEKLGLDIEAGVQNFVLDRRWLVNVANWVYIWGHWPVLIGSLVVLFVAHRGHYTRLRNAMLVSGAVGLLVFALVPVMPPRLLDDSYGYVDTVTQWSSSYRIMQPSFLVNKYAALPSYHVGWNLLAGIELWSAFRHPLIRFVAVASPLAMAFAVVATANHYQVDSIVGCALALGGRKVVRENHRRRTRRADLRPFTPAT